MKFPLFRYGQPLLSRTWSDTLSIIVSALFVAAALIVHRQLSALEFWVSILFFGGGGLFTLLSMLRSKKSDALAEQRTADTIKHPRLGPFEKRLGCLRIRLGCFEMRLGSRT